MYVRRPERPLATAAYGLKSMFNRRVWFVDANRPDKRTCDNTRNRHLNGPAWVEVMIFLDRIGLEGRLQLHSNHALTLPAWGAIPAPPSTGSRLNVFRRRVIR